MHTYNKATEYILERFPELKLIYYMNQDDYEGLPYVFYESVFTKYIIKNLSEQSEEKIREVFDFIENLLVDGDDEIMNLIEVAVIESLLFDKGFMSHYEKSQRFMGKTTKESFESCMMT